MQRSTNDFVHSHSTTSPLARGSIVVEWLVVVAGWLLVLSKGCQLLLYVGWECETRSSWSEGADHDMMVDI